MDQYVVPQFIDVEDKILGPITTRQFLIMLVTSLILFIAYKLADKMLFIFLVILIGGGSMIVAFLKINGQPFHFFLLNLFQTFRRPGLRLWNKRLDNAQLKELIAASKTEVVEVVKEVKHVSYNRIRDLSLIVNTGGYYEGGE